MDPLKLGGHSHKPITGLLEACDTTHKVVTIYRREHMTRWETVARRYEHFNPPTAGLLPAPILSKFRIWLEDDVIPMLTELTRQPRFREFATWSLRSLGRGADTAERVAVERVDQALVAAAQALIAVASHKRVNPLLVTLAPPKRPAASGSSEIGRAVAEHPLGLRPNAVPFQFEIAAVRRVAERDWEDLICLDDYF